MEVKFTKGEWLVRGCKIKSTKCSIEIAKVTISNEGKANSELIAAAPDMYKMIDELHKELLQAINEVNTHRAKVVNSQTESEPDYWDAQSCYEAQLLLKKARGE